MKVGIKLVDRCFSTVESETTTFNFKCAVMLPCVEGSLHFNGDSINTDIKIALRVNIVNCAIFTFNIFDSETELCGVLCLLILKNVFQIQVTIRIPERVNFRFIYLQFLRFKFPS